MSRPGQLSLSLSLSVPLPRTLDVAAASIVAAAASIAVAATTSSPPVPLRPQSPLCLGVLRRRLRSRLWRPQADLAKVWGPKSRDGVAMAIRPHPSPIVKDHWSIPQQYYANAVQKLLGSYLGVI